MESAFDVFLDHVATMKKPDVAMRASSMGGMQQCELDDGRQYTLFRRNDDVYLLAYPANDMIAHAHVSRIYNLLPKLRGLGLLSYYKALDSLAELEHKDVVAAPHGAQFLE